MSPENKARICESIKGRRDEGQLGGESWVEGFYVNCLVLLNWTPGYLYIYYVVVYTSTHMKSATSTRIFTHNHTSVCLEQQPEKGNSWPTNPNQNELLEYLLLSLLLIRRMSSPLHLYFIANRFSSLKTMWFCWVNVFNHLLTNAHHDNSNVY